MTFSENFYCGKKVVSFHWVFLRKEEEEEEEEEEEDEEEEGEDGARGLIGVRSNVLDRRRDGRII